MTDKTDKDIVVNEPKAEKIKRPERVPLHKQRTTTHAERPGFKVRWVNDLPGRIDAFIKAGWTPVVGNQDSKVLKSNVESQLGSVVMKVVNQGLSAACRHAILMEIPIELFEEDQREKQKINDQVEERLNPTKFKQDGGDYGSMRIDRDN